MWGQKNNSLSVGLTDGQIEERRESLGQKASFCSHPYSDTDESMVLGH